MNVPDMVANDIKRCVWILRTCLQMYCCKFNEIGILYAHGALINQLNLLWWV